jgi:hypothetical protein
MAVSASSQIEVDAQDIADMARAAAVPPAQHAAEQAMSAPQRRTRMKAIQRRLAELGGPEAQALVDELWRLNFDENQDDRTAVWDNNMLTVAKVCFERGQPELWSVIYDRVLAGTEEVRPGDEYRFLRDMLDDDELPRLMARAFTSGTGDAQRVATESAVRKTRACR